ncbi:unnamed protein product [Rotaria sordida]|uniref:DNA helicase n=1 Tax=Rotaria sordida TaxID=392033 RepID=A0A814M7X9_9BILA|nr:unnamed protein product [Rotaria sordida]
MEQPESNPTFCTNNCGFYGSSQFEGMCSKCYREHVNRSLTTGRTNSCNSFYTSSNTSVTTSSSSSSQTLLPNTSTNDEQQMRDDQDEVVGHMDEDNELPTTNTTTAIDQTVNKMDDDNSESPLATEEQLETTKSNNDQSINDSSTSPITRVVSAPTMPMTISRNIDIPGKTDSNISFSVMETSSLGADSTSPLTASSVDKKKRNRCTWPSCNKKLGLTGFDCRCGGQFCPVHRYANEHNCTFDYKEHGQNEILNDIGLIKTIGIVVATSSIRTKASYIAIQCRNIVSNIKVKPGLEGYAIRRKCNSITQPGQLSCPIDPYFIMPDKCQYLFNLIDRVMPGNKIILVGIYCIKRNIPMNKIQGKDKLNIGIRQPYIRVLGICIDTNGIGRSSTQTLTSNEEEEEEEFIRFLHTSNIYEIISNSIASSIYDVNDIKKSIACLLFDGSRKRLPDGLIRRGDINVLLIGDPGTAKSQLLKFINKVAPIGVYTSGKDSSAGGLTASVIRDLNSKNFVIEENASEKLRNQYVLMRNGINIYEHEIGKKTTIPITVRQLEALIRIAESLAKMRLSSFVDEALRLFHVSTFASASSGNLTGIEGFITFDDQKEVTRIEKQIRRRFIIGSQVSELAIVQDFIQQNYSERTIYKVLHAMIRRGDIQYRIQHKILIRIR